MRNYILALILLTPLVIQTRPLLQKDETSLEAQHRSGKPWYAFYREAHKDEWFKRIAASPAYALQQKNIILDMCNHLHKKNNTEQLTNLLQHVGLSFERFLVRSRKLSSHKRDTGRALLQRLFSLKSASYEEIHPTAAFTFCSTLMVNLFTILSHAPKTATRQREESIIFSDYAAHQETAHAAPSPLLLKESGELLQIFTHAVTLEEGATPYSVHTRRAALLAAAGLIAWAAWKKLPPKLDSLFTHTMGAYFK